MAGAAALRYPYCRSIGIEIRPVREKAIGAEQKEALKTVKVIREWVEGNGMKCKRCSAKVIRGVLERVCRECGWRTPSLQMLFGQAALVTLLCFLILVNFVLGKDALALYTTLAIGAVAVFGWANYAIVKKRRRG